jgi:hypothetical protein
MGLVNSRLMGTVVPRTARKKGISQAFGDKKSAPHQHLRQIKARAGEDGILPASRPSEERRHACQLTRLIVLFEHHGPDGP